MFKTVEIQEAARAADEKAESAPPRRLLRVYDTTDPRATEDFIYICALNIEDAMLTGGATPGVDYTILDLYRLAIQILPEMIKIAPSGAASSMRISA